MSTDLAEFVRTVPLIDHHCHGVTDHELDFTGFQKLLSESYRPPPEGTTDFQKPVGLAVRRFCAPLLDLEKGVSGEAYVARRAQLGSAEVNRRLLRSAGLSDLVIDTGHRASMILDVPDMAKVAGMPAHEIVRIEALAEEVARSGVDAARFGQVFAERLAERSKGAVGLKTIVAYRTTFAIDYTRPSAAAFAAATGAWMKSAEQGGRWRLSEPVVIRELLWAAAERCRERRFPLQVHVGVGDADILMHACDPTHFTPFIATLDEWDVPVTLLHCWPFLREAAWLSEVFRNVYYDVGFTLNFTAPESERVLAEAMEMGRFTKLLYSSDAFALPELFYLGAFLFRRALTRVLERWMADDFCSAEDAVEIARLIAAGNTRRIYSL
ncbi:MAG: amidohydrolase family protein [Hyphomicrobiales bacterium]